MKERWLCSTPQLMNNSGYPIKAMQPTAGRSYAGHEIMKTRLLQPTLALASGG
jgi:hypothetical protein